jgi:hypothetical protein
MPEELVVETTRVSVDPALVERYIMGMAQYGAYGETGVWRTVYDPAWVAATDQYAAWCEESGLETWRDAVGNVWGQLEGRRVTSCSSTAVMPAAPQPVRASPPRSPCRTRARSSDRTRVDAAVSRSFALIHAWIGRYLMRTRA